MPGKPSDPFQHYDTADISMPSHQVDEMANRLKNITDADWKYVEDIIENADANAAEIKSRLSQIGATLLDASQT